ncbi:ABC transporter permease [Sulfobacillus thermosulfidooxidans]|uniref:ABC transporter permease n=1 Tax=Sulfobacillus thermosulfidooxidans TaxID=28034 RepID=UPI00041CDEEA|nr:ABC transporter permease [Sulfobacillus thermosulfidooxidans]
MRHLIQRVGFLLVSIWAAVTINFVLPRLMPGNPAEVLLARYQGRLQPQALHALELQFGLSHKPLLTQYVGYLANLVHGQMGLSISYYPTPVTKVIETSLPWTLGLAGTSTIISVVVGTLLGIYSSWKRGSWLASALPTATTFLAAIPYFWVALLLLYVFGFVLGWFPLAHSYSLSLTPSWNWEFVSNVIYHSILPAVTIVLTSLGGWLVGMRNNMINTLGEDYVVFGEAKGISKRRLMLVYAARNAILPNVTGFAMALGFVVSGALLTEIVFSYPGVGFQLLTAVENEDYPLMQGIFLIIAIAVLLANFAVELLYARLDPRARREGASS